MLFATGTVAQAADAPSADKGREPVWRCDTAGFIEYPGSDVCFKIGGFVIAWIGGADEDGTSGEGFPAFGVRDDIHPTKDTFWMGAKGRLNFDVRQSTELGLVRAFVEMEALDKNSNSSGTFNLRHAYIQVGNWLMGKTWTTFRSIAATPGIFIDFNPFGAAGDQRTVRIVQLRYTIKLGNGVTVNLAIEDPAFHAANRSLDGGVFLTDSRNEVPDFVANIQFRGSWGKAQVSVGVHQSRFTNSFFAGSPSDSETGWAVLAGVQLKAGANNTIFLMGQYADGHNGAIESGGGAAQGFVVTTTGSVEGVETWTVAGGVEHKWRKNLKSTIGVSHVDNDYGADHTFVGALQVEEATSVWTNLVYTAVKNLQLGVGVMWQEVERHGGEEGDAVAVAAQAVRKF